jgi:hypothetical protein
MEIYDEERLLRYPTNGGNWAIGTKTDLKALQLYYRALAARTNEFPVASQAGTPAADVLLALSKYDAPSRNCAKPPPCPIRGFR